MSLYYSAANVLSVSKPLQIKRAVRLQTEGLLYTQ